MGFAPDPDAFRLIDRGETGLVVAALTLTILVSPFAPLLLAFLMAATGSRWPRWFTALLAVTVIPLGVFLTLATAALGGAGELMTLTKGILLVMATCGAVRTLSWTRHSVRGRRLTALLLYVPAWAGVLSLRVAGLIVLQAIWIAGGAPACLARHLARPAPISSIWDLRAFSFYTTESGYKDTSRWYFHGLLIVSGPDGEDIHNWSPRRLRFMPVDHPHRFVADPSSACDPIGPVWRSL